MKDSGFASASVNNISLNSFIMLVLFICTVSWFWYPQWSFPHSSYPLVICKCYLRSVTTSFLWLQNLQCLGTSSFLLLTLILLPPLPHWVCKEAHLLLFIMMLTSAVFCCTFSFLGYLPDFVFTKESQTELICTEPITTLSWGLNHWFSRRTCSIV